MEERLKIIEVPSCRPYAETDLIAVKVKEGLPKAHRTLTHLERYKLKEESRGIRVTGGFSDFQTPRSRSDIGKRKIRV